MNVQLLIKEISPEIPVFKGNPGDFTIFTTHQSECLVSLLHNVIEKHGLSVQVALQTHVG